MATFKYYDGTKYNRITGGLVPKTVNTTSDTETYSCNYVNNEVDKLLPENSKTTGTTNTYSCNYLNNAINGTVLYNTSGSNGSPPITLSKDISEFDYVEIFYKVIPDSNPSSAASQKSVKGVVGIPIILDAAVVGYFENSYYGIRLYSTTVTISGTTLTKPVGYNFSFKTANVMVFNDTRNDIYITKVIGYKGG